MTLNVGWVYFATLIVASVFTNCVASQTTAAFGENEGDGAILNNLTVIPIAANPIDADEPVHGQSRMPEPTEISIMEENTASKIISQGKVISPRYPGPMSTRSQYIECKFTALDQSGQSVEPHLRLNMTLRGSEKTELLDFEVNSFQGPLPNQQFTIKPLKNNFVMTYNRCSTLEESQLGSDFHVLFEANSALNVTCSHRFTNCTFPTVVIPDDNDPNDTSGMSNLVIIIAAAAAGGLLLIFLLIICCICKRKRRRHQLPPEKEPGQSPELARLSSFGTRTSNIYQEIDESGVGYYHEVDSNDTSDPRTKLHYNLRPVPELPTRTDPSSNESVTGKDGYDKVISLSGDISRPCQNSNGNIHVNQKDDDDDDDISDGYTRTKDPSNNNTLLQLDDDLDDGYSRTKNPNQNTGEDINSGYSEAKEILPDSSVNDKPDLNNDNETNNTENSEVPEYAKPIKPTKANTVRRTGEPTEHDIQLTDFETLMVDNTDLYESAGDTDATARNVELNTGQVQSEV